MTVRARHVFEVKLNISADEKKVVPRVYFQLQKAPELAVLGRGFLGFDLKPGTTVAEAEALVSKLNEMVTATSYTDPYAEAARINRDGQELRRRKREDRLN